MLLSVALVSDSRKMSVVQKVPVYQYEIFPTYLRLMHVVAPLAYSPLPSWP